MEETEPGPLLRNGNPGNMENMLTFRKRNCRRRSRSVYWVDLKQVPEGDHPRLGNLLESGHDTNDPLS
jgi:hypothetical protein